jgi:hypothetical protein
MNQYDIKELPGKRVERVYSMSNNQLGVMFEGGGLLVFNTNNATFSLPRYPTFWPRASVEENYMDE